MKTLFILLLLFPLWLTAQKKSKPQPNVRQNTKSVNGHDFVFKFTTTPYSACHDVEEVELYRNGKKLLTHTLKSVCGDCNSLEVEVGNYVLNDSTLTFYSYWGKVGDAPVSPYGVRKQVYGIGVDGRVAKVGGLIYLDAGHMMSDYKGYKGLKFLDSMPRSTKDKELLTEYKQTIKKEYNADFVKDRKQKKNLFQEVRSILSNEIQEVTKGWDELSKVWSQARY